MCALICRTISRYPQADVKRTRNRVVLSLHWSHPVCCLAWQQLVELKLELESLAAFCMFHGWPALPGGQTEIPCKEHTAQSSDTFLWSLQQSCFVFSKGNWLNMARCWLNIRFISLVTLGHTAVFSGN